LSSTAAANLLNVVAPSSIVGYLAIVCDMKGQAELVGHDIT
jgi:hypothetical protein